MTTTTYQSRYGFHRCNYELYAKLKHLHRCYWKTLRQFHAWHRWVRKEPQNRNGPEPLYCPCFVENKPWAKPVRRDGEQGFKLYPRTVVDQKVIELYHAARMPNELPVEPFPAEEVARIERLYIAVNDHFSEREKAEAAEG